MALFRPTELIPSTLTSDYSIDATKNNIFRFQLNGTSAITKFRVLIRKNDSTNTIVYDSGFIEEANPVYPIQYDGTPTVMLQPILANTLINGNQYKWSATVYWNDIDSVESYENVFYTYATATLTIPLLEGEQKTFSTNSVSFVGSLNAPSGVFCERFGFLLQNPTTGEILVDTISQDNIYSGQIKMVYDGFFSGVTYQLSAKAWLTNGTEVTAGTYTFSVSYPILSIDGYVVGQKTCDSGIMVEWPKVNYIDGTVSGNVSYGYDSKTIKSYYVDIPSGSSIIFNNINQSPMSISSSTSHVISFYAPDEDESGGGVELYSAKGTTSDGKTLEVKLNFHDGIFRINVNIDNSSNYWEYINTKAFNGTWYLICISPYGIYCCAQTSDLNGLYPASALHLSPSLYLKGETYSATKTYTRVLNIPTDATYSEVTLKGPQKTNYLWITNDILSVNDFEKLKDFTVEPEWTNNTVLLANFNNNSTSAGNFNSDTPLTGWLLYRQEQNNSIITYVGESAPSKQFLVDYGVSNQKEYTYYLFPKFALSIGSPIVSKPINTNWWEWYLLACDVNTSKNEFYVEDVFKFDLDVSSSNMSNNTAFNVLQNFTQYAKVQHSNANYWSGSLTALLGNCATSYKDTIKRMNEFKALTTDKREKFLKDRKGNLWRVSLSNAIGEQMNDIFQEQQVTVTFNWVETGKVDGSVIIGDPIKPKDEFMICDATETEGVV